MSMEKAILETSRLMLRELMAGDLDFVAAMLAHPEVMRYYPKCYSRAEAGDWLQRQLDRYASHGYGLWLVRDKLTGEPLGQVGLIPPRAIIGADETEIGYLIHRPFWRRGFASEGAAACRDYAFDVLDRPRVISLIRPENLPSQGVARKIGLTAEDFRIDHAGFEHMVFAMKRDARSSRSPIAEGR
jgi:RimJ/RimL family protein N-acetyltransferase